MSIFIIVPLASRFMQHVRYFFILRDIEIKFSKEMIVTIRASCLALMLATLIFLSPALVGVSLATTTNTASSPDESSEMVVWFYTGDFSRIRNSMVDNLLQKNINTIYFSDLDDGKGWYDSTKVSQYTSFIGYARSNGMKVYAVTLEDPKYVLVSDEELREAFESFITKTRYVFDAYVIDVEPHTINVKYGNQYPQWNTSQKYYLENYVRMSKILRSIADEHGVKYIDTIPPYYHAIMTNAGITGGVNQLSSHSINVMAYESTIEHIMNSTSKIRQESNIRLVINIKIAKDPRDDYLEGQEIPRAIETLKEQLLPIGIWYADRYFFNLHPSMFP
jgi:hypothetical protein